MAVGGDERRYWVHCEIMAAADEEQIDVEHRCRQALSGDHLVLTDTGPLIPHRPAPPGGRPAEGRFQLNRRAGASVINASAVRRQS